VRLNFICLALQVPRRGDLEMFSMALATCRRSSGDGLGAYQYEHPRFNEQYKWKRPVESHV
jgi:hypothetical protein